MLPESLASLPGLKYRPQHTRPYKHHLQTLEDRQILVRLELELDIVHIELMLDKSPRIVNYAIDIHARKLGCP